ncbi:MAG: hypothetical protein ACR2P6_08505 [Gammaproteobacteria bacterium]
MKYIAAAVVLTLCYTPAFSATVVLDQTSATGGARAHTPIFAGNNHFQSFTVGVDGVLSRVGVGIWQESAAMNTESVQLEMLTVSQGGLLGSVLGRRIRR